MVKLGTGFSSLCAQAELLDQLAILLEIALLQVLQEPPPPANQLQQAASRMMVFRVCAQMLGGLVDTPCQERDVHLWRAGVSLVATMLADDLLFASLVRGIDFLLDMRLRGLRTARQGTRTAGAAVSQ